MNSIQNTIKKNHSNEIIGLHEPFFEDTKSLDYLKNALVMIISSSDAEQDIKKAYQLGADEYLVKPINFTYLKELFTQRKLI